MGSRLYGVKGGKKRLISKTTYMSPRQNARALRAHMGHAGKAGWPKLKSGWQPKRRRRKLGARRKTTLIRQLFKWVKVPTKVRRRRVR